MTLANILTILLSVAACAITVWATLRADRSARDRDREQQLEQMKGLLQTMVVEKIEAAFNEIEKLQKAVGAVKEAHAHLKGFLQGKGCLVPDFCAEEMKESGS